MKRLNADLPATEEGMCEEKKALTKAYPNPVERFNFLYGNLSILDSKSASLLTFNAIGLTALAVWLEYVPRNWLHVTLDVVFVLFVISCAMCLITVWVFWSPPEHFDAPDEQIHALLERRRSRTKMYRGAWMVSLVAVFALLTVSIFHGTGTTLDMLGLCGDTCQMIFSEGNWGNVTSAP